MVVGGELELFSLRFDCCWGTEEDAEDEEEEEEEEIFDLVLFDGEFVLVVLDVVVVVVVVVVADFVLRFKSDGILPSVSWSNSFINPLRAEPPDFCSCTLADAPNFAEVVEVVADFF